MGKFVPKGYQKNSITVRIETEKLKKIEKAAAKANISRNQFINQCIDFALEHIADSESDKSHNLEKDHE